jgi:hypothetical protein
MWGSSEGTMKACTPRPPSAAASASRREASLSAAGAAAGAACCAGAEEAIAATCTPSLLVVEAGAAAAFETCRGGCKGLVRLAARAADSATAGCTSRPACLASCSPRERLWGPGEGGQAALDEASAAEGAGGKEHRRTTRSAQRWPADGCNWAIWAGWESRAEKRGDCCAVLRAAARHLTRMGLHCALVQHSLYHRPLFAVVHRFPALNTKQPPGVVDVSDCEATATLPSYSRISEIGIDRAESARACKGYAAPVAASPCSRLPF